MQKNTAILVIDDDPIVLGIVVELLESLDYEVVSVPNAGAAFIQAEELRPRLIITDIMMPVWGTGIHVYRKFRDDPRLKACPVIFMTSMDPLAVKAIVPNDPRVRVLYKPIDPTLLKQAVVDLIGKPLKG